MALFYYNVYLYKHDKGTNSGNALNIQIKL